MTDGEKERMRKAKEVRDRKTEREREREQRRGKRVFGPKPPVFDVLVSCWTATQRQPKPMNRGRPSVISVWIGLGMKACTTWRVQRAMRVEEKASVRHRRIEALRGEGKEEEAVCMQRTIKRTRIRSIKASNPLLGVGCAVVAVS